jgi:hypothetical protein
VFRGPLSYPGTRRRPANTPFASHGTGQQSGTLRSTTKVRSKRLTPLLLTPYRRTVRRWMIRNFFFYCLALNQTRNIRTLWAEHRSRMSRQHRNADCSRASLISFHHESSTRARRCGLPCVSKRLPIPSFFWTGRKSEELFPRT